MGQHSVDRPQLIFVRSQGLEKSIELSHPPLGDPGSTVLDQCVQTARAVDVRGIDRELRLKANIGILQEIPKFVMDIGG